MTGIIILIAVAVFVLILFLIAALKKPPQERRTPIKEEVDAGAAGRLAGAIRIPTVSVLTVPKWIIQVRRAARLP